MSEDDAPRYSRWARHRARALLLQAIYQWQLSGVEVPELQRQFAMKPAMKKADAEFFNELLRGVVTMQPQLDELLTPVLDRKVSELTHVERAVLRIGCYEMLERVDVPVRVVIDEAVGLAQSFGAEGSHGYINGVLDALGRQLRSAEMGARS